MPSLLSVVNVANPPRRTQRAQSHGQESIDWQGDWLRY